MATRLSPSTRRLARRRSAWIRPNRAGPWPQRARRWPSTSTVRWSSARPVGSSPSAARQSPHSGNGPTVLSQVQVLRTKPTGRCQRWAWSCRPAWMRAELAEPADQIIVRRRFLAGDELEGDDVAGLAVVVDVGDQAAVDQRDQAGRCHHAVAPQRVEPDQLGGDLVAGVIVRAVDAEHHVAAVAFHAERGVFGDGEQLEVGVLGNAPARQRAAQMILQALEKFGIVQGLTPEGAIASVCWSFHIMSGGCNTKITPPARRRLPPRAGASGCRRARSRSSRRNRSC